MRKQSNNKQINEIKSKKLRNTTFLTPNSKSLIHQEIKTEILESIDVKHIAGNQFATTYTARKHYLRHLARFQSLIAESENKSRVSKMKSFTKSFYVTDKRRMNQPFTLIL